MKTKIAAILLPLALGACSALHVKSPLEQANVFTYGDWKVNTLTCNISNSANKNFALYSSQALEPTGPKSVALTFRLVFNKPQLTAPVVQLVGYPQPLQTEGAGSVFHVLFPYNAPTLALLMDKGNNFLIQSSPQDNSPFIEANLSADGLYQAIDKLMERCP